MTREPVENSRLLYNGEKASVKENPMITHPKGCYNGLRLADFTTKIGGKRGGTIAGRRPCQVAAIVAIDTARIYIIEYG